jgi:hypothetical protein
VKSRARCALASRRENLSSNPWTTTWSEQSRAHAQSSRTCCPSGERTSMAVPIMQYKVNRCLVSLLLSSAWNTTCRSDSCSSVVVALLVIGHLVLYRTSSPFQSASAVCYIFISAGWKFGLYYHCSWWGMSNILTRTIYTIRN